MSRIEGNQKLNLNVKTTLALTDEGDLRINEHIAGK